MISTIRRHIIRNTAALLGVSVLTFMTVSCEPLLKYEGDCPASYQVAFTHTMNIVGADAFNTRVKSVSLFAFDASGQLAAMKTESGEALAAEHYKMEFTPEEIAPGTYDLIAWCGLSEGEAFILAGGDNPVTKNDLVCRLQRERDEHDAAVSRKRLNDLFHGMAEGVVFPESPAMQPVCATIDLTKNTNTVRVILQHYNGNPLQKDDFHFTVTDNNGTLNHDNTLLEDEYIAYREWAKAEAEVAQPGSRSDEIRSISSVVAEIDMARLVRDGHNPILTVNVDGKDKPILSLPLIDLLLAAKGEAKREMSDQEYLDRQDDYTLFFYLDDAYGWYAGGGIWVNSWHVIYSEKEL